MPLYTTEILAKRILLLSKIMLTSLVITILIFTNYLDLQDNKRNKEYIKLLTEVYARGDDGLRFDRFEVQRADYLWEKFPDKGAAHRHVRASLIAIFKQFGESIDLTTKGYDGDMNRFQLMNSNNQKISMAPAVKLDYAGQGRGPVTIDSAIRFFKKHCNPTLFTFVKAYDSVELKKAFTDTIKAQQAADSIRFSRYMAEQNTGNYPHAPRADGAIITGIEVPTGDGGGNHRNGINFNKLYLKNDSLKIDFGYESGRGAGQGGGVQYIGKPLHIKIETDTMMFPSTLQFAGFDSTLVVSLARHPDKLKDISNLYGNYQLNTMDRYSEDLFDKNNSAVSILGFDVSRRWFPIAMFLLLTVVYMALFQTTSKAVKLNLKIISNYASEDALDIITEKRRMRFVLWALNPIILLIMVLISAPVTYSFMNYLSLALVTVICTVYGGLSYRQSLKL